MDSVKKIPAEFTMRGLSMEFRDGVLWIEGRDVPATVTVESCDLRTPDGGLVFSVQSDRKLLESQDAFIKILVSKGRR